MTIQGHPEFRNSITTDITRELDVINPEIRKTCDTEALRAERPASDIPETWSDTRNDGVDVVGKMFWRMFGVEGKRCWFSSV